MNKRAMGLVLGLCVLCTTAFAEVSPESIIQIYQRLENLEKQTRELHGENEVLKHQIDQLKDVQKKGFLNVDERIDELAASLKEKATSDAEKKTDTTDNNSSNEQAEVKVVEKPAPVDNPDVKVEADPETPQDEKPQLEQPEEKKPEANSQIEEGKLEDTKTANKSIREPTAYEKETYQAAFNKMNSSPTAATKAFEEYIKMQPESPLAANAQYWIGEIMYSHNNYKGAVQEFIKVLQNYKYSNKAPDAAIKLGYSFYALKNWAYARRTFEDVLKYFPENKNAVNLATQRLEMMKAAGN